MDYDNLSRLIIKDLRGELSQNRLSKLLGYELNIVHKWEKGRKSILWEDFLDICKLKKIPIEDLLNDITGNNELSKDEWSLVHFLLESESLSKLSSSLNISRDVLYNLLNKKTRPKFAIILELVNYFSWMSIEDFLEKICTEKMLDSTFPNYNLIKKFNSLTISEPKIALLLSTINLKLYQDLSVHDELLLAKKVKIDVNKVKEYLGILEEIGIIKMNNNKFEIQKTGGLISVQNYSEDQLYHLDKFWIEQALQYFKEVPPELRDNSKRGFLRLTFDIESMKELEDLTFEYFQKVKDVSSKSKKAETIRVVNINYFDPLW